MWNAIAEFQSLLGPPCSWNKAFTLHCLHAAVLWFPSSQKLAPGCFYSSFVLCWSGEIFEQNTIESVTDSKACSSKWLCHNRGTRVALFRVQQNLTFLLIGALAMMCVCNNVKHPHPNILQGLWTKPTLNWDSMYLLLNQITLWSVVPFDFLASETFLREKYNFAKHSCESVLNSTWQPDKTPEPQSSAPA